LSRPLFAQAGPNVLVVANDASPASRRIADYYAAKRGVPASQVLHLRAPVTDEIDRSTYLRLVEAPIADWLARNSAQDRILYLVLTKDVPLRIGGTSGREGTVASVDSELTLLYRKMLHKPIALAGRVMNPYFAQQPGAAPFKRFTHEVADIYLVTRLDAFTETEVVRLIDRGAEPSTSGTIVLDQRGRGDAAGDRWLEEAADTLRKVGAPHVLLERTGTVVKNEPGVLGYYSWGSNDPAFTTRRLNLGFVAGSIAATFVSTDGRTFREPPADWTLGTWDNAKTHYAGSPQSLTGDLIREGATAAAGHVAEPYLDATIRPQVLFPAYLAGLNVAEAFYLAMPYLSWQTVVVGDPLCAPFRRSPLRSDEIDRGIAPETELPTLFSARRFEQVGSAAGRTREVAARLLRTEARLARGDRAGARASAEEAVALDATSVEAERALAQLDEADGQFERAASRYRKILERAPTDLIALNNLAYSLAIRFGKPREALPLAQRAAAKAPRQMDVIDTLAWIHHLLGDNDKAAALLAEVMKTPSPTPEMLIHSATVQLALGNVALAEQQLTMVLASEPEAAMQTEAKRLLADVEKTKPKKN
jgi:uncharacterized protein (TIGR03790 family)